MVSRAKVAEVERLLAEGRHSHRSIARETGVSRATIARIASGEWGQRYGGDFRRGDDLAPNLDAPPVRCAGCGGMVHLPCVLCRVRADSASVRPKDTKAGRLAGQVVRAAQVRAAVAAENARRGATAAGSSELVGAR